MNARSPSLARRVTIAVSGIVSCLFIYPFVHEFGHLFPAVASGAEVNRFVWTPLLGRTHVSLDNVPGHAMPWVDAGGMLVPTLLGTLLIVVWVSLPSRSPAPTWRFWLLIPGGIMLIGNFGIIIEVLLTSNELDHMHALAQLLAGSGGLATMIELSPAIWSTLVIGFVVRSAWRRSAANGQT